MRSGAYRSSLLISASQAIKSKGVSPCVLLVSLGDIKFDGDWTVRMMGDNRAAVGRAPPKRVAGPERCEDADGLPFDLVLERAGAHGDLNRTEVEHPVPSHVPPPVQGRLSLS